MEGVAFPGESLIESYPEENLFDREPQILNLIPPSPPSPNSASASLRATLLQNPDGCNMRRDYTILYGVNPLSVDRHATARPTMVTPKTPPPLPIFADIDSLEFLEYFYSEGELFMFKVRIREDVRLLKVVSVTALRRRRATSFQPPPSHCLIALTHSTPIKRTKMTASRILKG